VRFVSTECLDHLFIFNERVLAEYVGYFNPLAPASRDRTTCALRDGDTYVSSMRYTQAGRITAIPLFGGRHHVDQQAA
jgi:hypothetical protein